jgi:hypothetical protein
VISRRVQAALCWLAIQTPPFHGNCHQIPTQSPRLRNLIGQARLVTSKSPNSEFKSRQVLTWMIRKRIGKKYLYVYTKQGIPEPHIPKPHLQNSLCRMYHLSPPRQLSELFINHNGGCSIYYPGIGDIEYVKDLMTDEVATENFNCSQFGPTYPSKLGWVSREFWKKVLPHFCSKYLNQFIRGRKM